MEAEGIQGLLWKYKYSVTGSTWKKNWVFCDGKKFLQWGGNMRPDKSQVPKYSLDLIECTVKESGQRPFAFEIIDNFTKKSMIFATNSDQSYQVWWYALSHPKSEPGTPTSPFKPYFGQKENRKGVSSPISKKNDDDRENGDYFEDEEAEDDESEEEDEYASKNRNATIIRKYFEKQNHQPLLLHSLSRLIKTLDNNLVPNRVLQFIAQQLQYPSLDGPVTCKEFLSIWLLFEEVFIPSTKAQCFEYYLYPTPGTPNPNLLTFQGRTNTHQISYICPMMFRIHIPTHIMSRKSPLMTHTNHTNDNDADNESSMHEYMEDLIRTSSTKILEQLTLPSAAVIEAATASATASPNPSCKPYDWYGVYMSYLIEIQHLTKKYQHTNTNNINNELSAEAEAEKQHFFDEVIFQQSVSIMTLWHSFHIMAMQGCELFVQEYTLPIHLKSMVPIKFPSVVMKTNKNSAVAVDELIGEERNPHAIAEGILGTQAGLGTPLSHNNTANQPQLLSMNRVEIMSYLYLQEQVYEYHGIYLYSFTLHLLDPTNAAEMMHNNNTDDPSAAWHASNESMYQRMYCKAYELYQKIYLTEWKNYLVLQREYDRIWMEDYLATRYCPHLHVSKDQTTNKQEDDEVTEGLEDVEVDEEAEEEYEDDVEERGRRGGGNRSPMRLHHRDSSHHAADDDGDTSASHQMIMLDEMLVRRRFITMVDYHGYRMIAYVPTPGNPIPSSPLSQHQPIQEIMQSIILKLQSRLYAIHPMTMSSYSLLPSSSYNKKQQDSAKKQGYYVNHSTVLSPDLFPIHTPDVLIKQLRKELIFTFTRYTSNDPNTDVTMEGSDSDEDEGEEEEEESSDEEENERNEKNALLRRRRSYITSAANNHKKKLITKQHFLINEEAQTAVHHAHYTGNNQAVNQDDEEEDDDGDKVLGGTEEEKAIITPTSITPWISLCHHLYSNVLPTFLHHLDQYLHTQASSGSLLTTASSSPYGLTNLLHRYGLNIRHLGILYSLTKNPFHKQIFLTEMLCRSVKLIYQTLMTTYIQEMSNESLLASLRSKSSLLHFQEFHHVMNEYKQEIVLWMLNIFYPCSQYLSSSSSFATSSSQSTEQVKTKKQLVLQQSEFMDMLLDILYNKFGVVLANTAHNPADLPEGEFEEEEKNNAFEYLMALELKKFEQTKAKEEEQKEKDSKKRAPSQPAIRITPNINTTSAQSSVKPGAMHWLDQYDLHPIQFFHSLQYHLGCQLKETVNTTKLHPKRFQNPSNIPFLTSDMIHFFLPKVHIQQSDEEEMSYWDIPYDLTSQSTSLALSSSLTEWMVTSGLSEHPLQTTNTFHPMPGHHSLHGSKGLVGRWSGLGEADHHIGLVGYGGNVDYFFAFSYLPCFWSQKMITEGFSLLQCYYYLKVPLYHHLLTLIAPTASSAVVAAASTAAPSLGAKVNADANPLSSTPYLPKLAWSQQYALSNITYHYLTLCGQLKQMREYQHILKTYLQHPYTLYSFLPTHDILSLSFHHLSLSNVSSNSSARMSTYNLLDQLYYSSAYSLLPSHHVGHTVTTLTLISTLEAQQHPSAYTQARILLHWLLSCWNYCHSPGKQQSSPQNQQTTSAGGGSRYSGIAAMIGYLCYRLGQISVKLKEDPKQSIAWFGQAYRMYYQFSSPESTLSNSGAAWLADSINSQGSVSPSSVDGRSRRRSMSIGLGAGITGTGHPENVSEGGVFMTGGVRADGCFVLSVPLSQQSTPQLYQALHLLYCLSAQYSLSGSAATTSSSSSNNNNMLHTLSQIPNYLNHYTQLNAQLTAFQQHYAQTSYALTTGLGHRGNHHHRGGEDATAGLLRVQCQVSDEIVALILSTYELLITGYSQYSEYHFALNYLQQLLLFVHCLLLSSPSPSLSPAATPLKPRIFLDPLTQQRMGPSNLTSDAYLTSLYVRLNIQLINNLMLTYSHTTRHLLTSITTDYNARSYHSAMTVRQQQLLVRNEYLGYDECILIMVDFLIAVWWNHGTAEYVEGLVRKVLQVEEYLDNRDQNEEEGGEYDDYEDDSEVEEDDEDEEERENNNKKQKKHSVSLTVRCYLCDEDLVEDYLMTKPAVTSSSETITPMLLQSIASSTAHVTRLQRILGRRRRHDLPLSTTPSTALQASRLTRQEIHTLRRLLPLYGQVFVLDLLLTQPTVFAQYVTRLYSLPPVQYIPPADLTA